MGTKQSSVAPTSPKTPHSSRNTTTSHQNNPSSSPYTTANESPKPFTKKSHQNTVRLSTISNAAGPSSRLSPLSLVRAASRRNQRLSSTLELCSPFGAYLTLAELHKLAKACRIVTYAAGKQLDESPFFIPVVGSIQVFSEDGERLCTKSAGSFFTRRAGLGLSAGASSGVGSRLIAAERASVLLVTSQERLSEFLDIVSSEGREGFRDICLTNIAMRLHAVPFIAEAQLKPAQGRALGDLCSYLAVPEGTYIFEQGDFVQNFYIVLQGVVQVVINEHELTGRSGSDEEVLAGVRRSGETFGLAAIVYNARTRKYGMVTTERSLLLVISKEVLVPFLAAHPSLDESLMVSTKRFLLQRYAAMKTSIFYGLQEEYMLACSRKAKFVNYTAGDVVYSIGDKPKAFYLVAHGELNLDSDINGEPDRVLRTGSYFGEVGMLLPNTPCIATITCREDCCLLALDCSDFVAAFEGNESVRVELLIKLMRKACTVEAILQHGRAHRLFVDYLLEHFGFAFSLSCYNALNDLLYKEGISRGSGGGGDAGGDAGGAAGWSQLTHEMVDAHLKSEIHKVIKQFTALGSGGGVSESIKMELDKSGSSWEQTMRSLEQKLAATEKGALTQTMPLLVELSEQYSRLIRHCFARFIDSDTYAHFLDEVGAYDDKVRPKLNEEDLKALQEQVSRVDLARLALKEPRAVTVDGGGAAAAAGPLSAAKKYGDETRANAHSLAGGDGSNRRSGWELEQAAKRMGSVKEK